jgi:trans-aconitate 2-methyltransferase
VIAIISSKNKFFFKKGALMNKYYMFCCVLLSLQTTHQINSAQADKWDGEKYKQNSSPQDHFAQYALAQITIKEDDSVIDLGCGNGKNTHIISQKTKGLVIGVDLSSSQITKAQSDYQAGNLHYQVGDMAHFTSSQKFNKATGLCSLSWVPEQDKAYKTIATLLQPGGQFVGLVTDKNAPILRAYYQAFALKQWQEHFKNYKPSFYPSDEVSVKAWLDEAGLDVIAIKKAEIPSMSMQRAMFLKALEATPGVKDAIPQDLYSNFIEDVADQYVTIVPKDEAGNIQIDSGLLLVIAQKP